jgi:hypothetical protein
MGTDRNVPRTYRREWIVPRELPDEGTIEELRAVFATESRLAEAWVVGSRMTPVDGSEARESADVALVFEPSAANDTDKPVPAFMELMQALEAKGHGRGTGRSWLILSRELIAAHREHATQIYARSVNEG